MESNTFSWETLFLGTLASASASSPTTSSAKLTQSASRKQSAMTSVFSTKRIKTSRASSTPMSPSNSDHHEPTHSKIHIITASYLYKWTSMSYMKQDITLHVKSSNYKHNYSTSKDYKMKRIRLAFMPQSMNANNKIIINNISFKIRLQSIQIMLKIMCMYCQLLKLFTIWPKNQIIIKLHIIKNKNNQSKMNLRLLPKA